MTINFEQLPVQIQGIVNDVEAKERELTTLNLELATFQEFIRSQSPDQIIENSKKLAEMNSHIGELQTDLHLLKWKQGILEDAVKNQQDLTGLEERTKTESVFKISFTDANGALRTFDNTERMEQLKHELEELDKELIQAENHWNFEQSEREKRAAEEQQKQQDAENESKQLKLDQLNAELGHMNEQIQKKNDELQNLKKDLGIEDPADAEPVEQVKEDNAAASEDTPKDDEVTSDSRKDVSNEKEVTAEPVANAAPVDTNSKTTTKAKAVSKSDVKEAE
jgi:hypothetical protein